MLVSNNHRNFTTSPTKNPTAFGALSKAEVTGLKHFKEGTYHLNRKLRGLDRRPFTADEKNIVAALESAPKRILRKDTFVYRGIGSNKDFNPVDSLQVGEVFLEKGFSSVSKIKNIAEVFQFGCGVLAKILLPKGTEVVDIDTLLLKNTKRLPKDFWERTVMQGHPKHEWVLLPNAKYEVTDFAKKENPITVEKGSDGQNICIYDTSRGHFDLTYILPKKK